LDIITRAAKLAPHIIVAVANNPLKTPLFTAAQRVALLHEVTGAIPNIEVVSFDGLLVHYAKRRGVTAILRGIRDGEDAANETRYAWHNRLFEGEIETLLLPASAEFVHVSGRIVREAAAHIYPSGLGDEVLQRLVPATVRKALQAKWEPPETPLR